MRQVVLAVAAVVVLTLGMASPSSAHAALSSTNPADAAQLSAAPPEVVLQFTDEVIELGAVVSVAGPSGSVDVGGPTVSGTTVTAELPDSLPAGSYSVDWRVSASDGHPISGTFSFSVTSSTATPRAGPSGTAPAPTADAPEAPTALGGTDAASSEEPAGQDGPSWVMWLFVATAVLFGLLLAAFAFVRTRRGR